MFNSTELVTIKQLVKETWTELDSQVDDEPCKETYNKMFILRDIMTKIDKEMGIKCMEVQKW